MVSSLARFAYSFDEKYSFLTNTDINSVNSSRYSRDGMNVFFIKHTVYAFIHLAFKLIPCHSIINACMGIMMAFEEVKRTLQIHADYGFLHL